MKMMESLELVDDDFTLNNAMLCYVWCRMSTIDEVKDFNKFESLTFVDLLEALGQVANSKHLPLSSDMQEAGINSLQWVQAKAAGVVLRLGSYSLCKIHSPACKKWLLIDCFTHLQETPVRPLWCQIFSRTPMHARAGHWLPS